MVDKLDHGQKRGEPPSGTMRGDPASHEYAPRAQRSVSPATWLAGAAVGGMALSLAGDIAFVWPWITVAFAGVITAFIARNQLNRTYFAGLLITCAAGGGGWASLRMHHLHDDDLATMVGEASRIVRLRGIAEEAPELRARTAGSMAAFDYRGPASYFPMRVEQRIDDDGVTHGVRGRVLVRVDESIEPFQAGDRVTVTGSISRFGPPMNPGEYDYSMLARGLGQAGMVMLPDRRLVEADLDATPGFMQQVRAVRQRVRRRAGAWLLSDLPAPQSQPRDALLNALLLGQREPRSAEIDAPFRRVGLAHLLAISGLHLGLLVGFVAVTVRLGGAPRRWHGWLLIALVLAYLFIAQVRLPLLRAGVMTLAGSLGFALGRQLQLGAMITLSAVGLLIWRPDQLASPGFQLSYGVVLGLMYFAAPVRTRWFGTRDLGPPTLGAMILEWLKSMLAAATVAWAVATPIVLYHFGMLSPFAVPLSVLVLPIVAIVLSLGFAKMLCALVLPSGALLLALPLSVAADLVLSIVSAADAMPGSSFHLPRPSPWWAVAASIWVCAWGCIGLWGRRAMYLSGVCLAVWLLAPVFFTSTGAALRVDMLAVGDGTCIIARTEDRTVVFDAGSSTNLNAGDASIVPAMRALGVRRIDAVMVSHANLDHYAAVIEVVDVFRVDEVLITPHMRARAEADPVSALAYLLEQLTARRVSVRTVHAGEQRADDTSTMTWLHPPADARYTLANDESMVVRVEVQLEGGRSRSLLLTGDIQSRAIANLIENHQQLQADIVELPHHGSFSDGALALIEQLDPEVVLQSTGWSRWARDAWGGRLNASITRMVTARDGACWVEIDHDGAITWGRFLVDD